MRSEMSANTRKELVASLREEYAKASREGKSRLLDTFVKSTQYSRKHAIALLSGNNAMVLEKKKRGRSPKLGPEGAEALVLIWNLCNRICSKRFVPAIGDFLENLTKSGHLNLSEQATAALLSISPATADRILKSERAKQPRSLSFTKRAALVKNKVPIRTFTEWKDIWPGFFEIDTVAHSSSDPNGPFLSTLNMTDIATCWTVPMAIRRKSAIDVIDALGKAARVLPFELLGIDFDNGSEFLNEELIKWSEERKITYTRSREYKKNDQAWIEEKNCSVVRKNVGRDRYQGDETWATLTALYAVLSLYYNYFLPCQKLLFKTRNGAKTYKRHDMAKTPYQRVLENPHVPEENKQAIRAIKEKLNVLELFTKLKDLQAKLKLQAVDVPNPVLAAALAQRNATYKFVTKTDNQSNHSPNVKEEPGPGKEVTRALKGLIEELTPGTCIRATDLQHIGNRSSLDMSLSRLHKQGILEKVSWGTYQIPFHPHTQNLEVSGTNLSEATV